MKSDAASRCLFPQRRTLLKSPKINKLANFNKIELKTSPNFTSYFSHSLFIILNYYKNQPSLSYISILLFQKNQTIQIHSSYIITILYVFLRYLTLLYNKKYNQTKEPFQINSLLKLNTLIKQYPFNHRLFFQSNRLFKNFFFPHFFPKIKFLDFFSQKHSIFCKDDGNSFIKMIEIFEKNATKLMFILIHLLYDIIFLQTKESILMQNFSNLFQEAQMMQSKQKQTFSKMNNKRINNFSPFQVVVKKEKIERPRKKKDEDQDYRIKEAKSQQVRWTKTEDQTYMKFIKQNSSLFNTENMRRTGRVFMRMSLQMKGLRTPNQCKSHHQKMQKVTESGQLDEIINYLEMKYSLTAVKDTKTKEIEDKQKPASQELQQNGFRINVVDWSKGLEIVVQVSQLKMDSW